LYLVVCVNCFTEKEYADEFTQWTIKYRKSFDGIEWEKRFGIFKENMDYVASFNRESTSMKVGLDRFADLSNAEYLANINEHSGDWLPSVYSPALNDMYNNTVDWRSSILHPRTDGACSPDWANVVVQVLEAAYYITHAKDLEFSIQQLIDCTFQQGNKGCNGGTVDNVWRYFTSDQSHSIGIETENCYPFTGIVGGCNYNPQCAIFLRVMRTSPGSESELEYAVSLKPVAAVIDASHLSFQLYQEGIYYEPACSTTNVNHAVVVAGFGADDNSTAQYWIVLNSFGADWGMRGSILMAKK